MRPLLGISLVTVLIGLSAAATCPATGTARVAHSMSCERYFECSNGVGVETTCTGGLFFNVQRQECTNPREANCTVPKTVCPPPVVDELIVLADGKNCHNFFICFNGAPMPQQCAPARVYNRNTYNCDESVCRVSVLMEPYSVRKHCSDQVPNYRFRIGSAQLTT